MDREQQSPPPEILAAAEALPEIHAEVRERRASTLLPTAAPRLSIAHLLIWIAFSAMFLAAVRKLNPIEPGSWGLVLAAFGAIGYGAAWTGLFIWLGRLARGAVWPVEPGHWVLIVLAVRLGLDMIFRLWLSQWFRSTETVLDAVTVCCLVLPLMSRSLSFVWQVCCTLLLLLYAWPLIISIVDGWIFVPGWIWAAVTWTSAWQTIVFAAIVDAFALIDLPERRERGWLHWSGIAVCSWLAIVSYFMR